MLTENQKRLLENQLYKLIKESFFENANMENFFPEEKSDHHDEEESNPVSTHDRYQKSKEEKKKKKPGNDTEEKKNAVLDWLEDEQEKDSVLSYSLWPDMDEDSARGLFSKKKEGKREWKPEEINNLYNYINSKIKHSKFDN
jgi:hypothetical protein